MSFLTLAGAVILSVLAAGEAERRWRLRRGARRIRESMAANLGGPHEYRPAAIHEFPHLDHGFYAAKTAELEAIGFTRLGDVENLTITRAGTGLPVLIRVLAGDEGTTQASLYHARFPRAGRPEIAVQALELETAFDDGTFVCTSTSMPSGLDFPPEISFDFLHPGTSAAQVADAHAARVARKRAASPAAAPVRMDTIDDALRLQRRMEETKARFRRSRPTLITRDELRRIGGPGMERTANDIGDEMERQARER